MNSRIAVRLTESDLKSVFDWANERNEFKELGGVRTKKVSPRSDVETHYIGLKAEYAFAKLFGLEPDRENRLCGDIYDFRLYGGYTADIKVSRRDLFMFPDAFKSSIAILANPLSAPERDYNGNIVQPERDPFLPNNRLFGWAHVVFVGWADRKTFREKASKTSLGYGPVLLMDRDNLLPMYRVANWIMGH